MNLWKKIVEQQTKYYNKWHENKIYQFENKMLLRNLNIRTFRSKKKIDHRLLNFFEIIKKIEIQIYRLNFSTKYDAIHFVFHVFLLKFWYFRNDKNSKSQIILIKNEKKWKINKMLNKRVKKNEIEYFIEWINSSFYENFWKFMKHFNNAQKIIDNFEFVKKQKKSIVKFKRAIAKSKKNKFKTITLNFNESQTTSKKRNKSRKKNWLRDRAWNVRRTQKKNSHKHSRTFTHTHTHTQ